jgi:hypothetical protein
MLLPMGTCHLLRPGMALLLLLNWVRATPDRPVGREVGVPDRDAPKSCITSGVGHMALSVCGSIGTSIGKETG